MAKRTPSSRMLMHVMTPDGQRIINPYYKPQNHEENDSSHEEREQTDAAVPTNDAQQKATRKRPRGRLPKRSQLKKQQSVPANFFEKMMNASAKQAKKKKRASSAQSESEESNKKRLPRESEKDGNDELQALGGAGSKPSWNESTLKYILDVRERMIDSVGFDEHGAHDIYGEWPEFASGVTVSYGDPLSAAKSAAERDKIDSTYFSQPDIFFWAPELRWPWLYPHKRPMCPWHHDWQCVRHDGWTFYPRRAIGDSTNIALLGRKHRCIVRCKAKEKPYNFLGMADEVISQAPDYVQAYWNEHGFILSHRGAVKRPIINQMRSLMAHGAGASGFSKSLMEMYRNTYMNRRKMWHAFSDCRYHDPGALSTRMQRAIFPKFDDPEYDVKVPSTTFLTSLCIKEIERHIPYYKRKLEMVSGKALSGDHSHKIAKVILIEGKRGFQGLYTLMNEFGKIVGFWLVNSTNMREVEERLRDIERRYRQHGFSGPFMFTADMCCPTRGFLAGTNNNKKMPVFPTLVGGPQNSTTQEDASTTPVADNDSTAESAQQQNSAIQEDASTMPTAQNRTAESAQHQNSAIQEDASTMLTINNSTAESAQQENRQFKRTHQQCRLLTTAQPSVRSETTRQFKRTHQQC